MNKTLMETIKDFINDSIKEATKLKETLSQTESDDTIEKLNEIRKIKNKSYAEQRAVEIANKFNTIELVDSYYKLGLAHAYGNIMYMLDEDFDKKDMKKLIMDITKDDTQFRCDVFGVWGELMDKSK